MLCNIHIACIEYSEGKFHVVPGNHFVLQEMYEYLFRGSNSATLIFASRSKIISSRVDPIWKGLVDQGSIKSHFFPFVKMAEPLHHQTATITVIGINVKAYKMNVFINI